MTDSRDILANLEADPESDILAAMLTDALMEEKEMWRSEADRYVERARDVARSARQMEFAAELIRAKGPAYYRLREAVCELLGFDGSQVYVLNVVSGDDVPRVLTLNGLPVTGWLGSERAVALPAGWVCRWFREHDFPVRAPYSRKRKQ